MFSHVSCAELPDTQTQFVYMQDMQTKHMMMVHGIQHVRGGTYSKIYLNKHEVGTIQRELWHAQGACVRCGSMLHWVRNCPCIPPSDDTSPDTRDNDSSDDDSFMTAPDFDEDTGGDYVS